jgi:hypothetical protein
MWHPAPWLGRAGQAFLSDESGIRVPPEFSRSKHGETRGATADFYRGRLYPHRLSSILERRPARDDQADDPAGHHYRRPITDYRAYEWRRPLDSGLAATSGRPDDPE